MDNKSLIKYLRRAIALQELHDINPFKVRVWQNAVFALENITEPVAAMTLQDQETVLGKAVAAKVSLIIKGEPVPEIAELEAKTPSGVLDMMGIKGLGPKKLVVLWREHNIDSVEKLQAACERNELAKIKGFGEKTQANILQALQYTKSNRGKLHFADAEPISAMIAASLEQTLGQPIFTTGQIRSHQDTVDELAYIVEDKGLDYHNLLSGIDGLIAQPEKSGPFTFKGILQDVELPIKVFISDSVANTLLLTSASPIHLDRKSETGITLRQAASKLVEDETTIYQNAGLPYIIPELRQGHIEWDFISSHSVGDLIKFEDLRGVLHNHSTYSDGAHTLEQMAEQTKLLGFEYLGMADHSQSAFYANGLRPDRVKQQQAEIEFLNSKFAPFKIFKGIESDILNDGSLDYEPEVLASFDYVVASVHSNLGMETVKATDRLIKAISNPFTTILGHPSGRLLLRREGYLYDQDAVIEACKHYNVILELNADPWRLDIDWRMVWKAQKAGLMISINPDAHHIDSLVNMRYGVVAGRKGGLLKAHTFNALGLAEIEQWFITKKEAAEVAS